MLIFEIVGGILLFTALSSYIRKKLGDEKKRIDDRAMIFLGAIFTFGFIMSCSGIFEMVDFINGKNELEVYTKGTKHTIHGFEIIAHVIWKIVFGIIIGFCSILYTFPSNKRNKKK